MECVAQWSHSAETSCRSFFCWLAGSCCLRKWPGGVIGLRKSHGFFQEANGETGFFANLTQTHRKNDAPFSGCSWLVMITTVSISSDRQSGRIERRCLFRDSFRILAQFARDIRPLSHVRRERSLRARRPQGHFEHQGERATISSCPTPIPRTISLKLKPTNGPNTAFLPPIADDADHAGFATMCYHCWTSAPCGSSSDDHDDVRMQARPGIAARFTDR